MKRWSRTELQDYLNHCNSIKRMIGGTPIFKKRAILDNSGKPVHLRQFKSVVNSPERLVLRNKFSYEEFQKSPKEKALLRAAKKDYKEGMKALLGDNWKKLSNSMSIFNVPDDSKVVTQIQKQLL